MDKPTLAVLLSFVLYVMYVLVPMVPAIAIYRIFPKTRVGITGPLGNLSVRASGAFAAYIVTVGLGYFLVSNTLEFIRTLTTPTWLVKAEVQLTDDQGNPISRTQLLDALQVELKPDVVTPAGKYVDVKLIGHEQNLPKLVFHVPGFRDDVVNFAHRQVKIDRTARLIELKDPITLQQAPPYNADTATTASEDRTGGPPVNR
jgi:hypothetical protein